MIFDYDVLFAILILIVGTSIYTVAVFEDTEGYTEAVEFNVLNNKAISTMESLLSEGTLENVIVLLNTDIESSIIDLYLDSRINYDNYNLVIGNYSYSKGTINENFAIVHTIVQMNRSSGWYVIYWNTQSGSKNVNTMGPFSDEDTAFKASDSISADRKKVLYYHKSGLPVNASLTLYTK
ncbi:hypothetical protein J3E07_000159 [Methanococcus voltae]|uniref:Uncharacterized protein n=2 Tax=Methanococcus voltae TaxID=2188 RepID=A0A8J7UTX8_METVO|nr:hypothetical protein [Methanococcus voltae]MBP2200761.1 hypothetical protein [Methanococcus voltae]MCS3921485.1 hypothetical protein [Methanococcus voltae PS]